MSSFNINGPSNRPAVTEAQNMMNNGGGGNLGYMQSGGKKKRQRDDEPVIIDGEIEDEFVRSEDDSEEDYEDGENNSDTEPENQKETLADKIGGFFNKTFAQKKEKPDSNTPGDFLSLSTKETKTDNKDNS